MKLTSNVAKRMLAGATLALLGGVAMAQSAGKPSPYQGTSEPPVTDVIRATEAPEVTPPPAVAAAPAPVAKPSAAMPAVKAADGNATGRSAANPDEDIVTGGSSAATAPSLQRRSATASDPDADIVTAVSIPANQLVEGTAIHTRLDRELSSSENGTGTLFTAQVTQDVMQNGRVIIPAGSVVHGRVVHADYGRRIAGPATMRLLASEVTLPDGMRYSITAVPSLTARGSHTKVNSEGTIETRDEPKRIGTEYAIGAGAGAASGAVFGGPIGAAVGTVVGAGLTTTHILRNREAAVLPAGSELTFGLTRPMQLTPVTTTASR